LREVVYHVLTTWLRLVGPSGGSFSPSEKSGLEDLITEIFYDVSQLQPEALQVSVEEANEIM
jgi:hypothetical protein